MRIARLLALLCVAPCLMAGGEYDRFRVGLSLGVGWSPSKEYAVFSETSNGERQLAALAGLVTRFHFWPGRSEFGIDLDGLRSLSLESGKGAPQVTTTLARTTFRFVLHTRNVTSGGAYVWFGPSLNRARVERQTSSPTTTTTSVLQETLTGLGLGLGTRSHGETTTSHWEASLRYVKAGKLGSKIGGLSIELAAGIVW